MASLFGQSGAPHMPARSSQTRSATFMYIRALMRLFAVVAVVDRQFVTHKRTMGTMDISAIANKMHAPLEGEGGEEGTEMAIGKSKRIAEASGADYQRFDAGRRRMQEEKADEKEKGWMASEAAKLTLSCVECTNSRTDWMIKNGRNCTTWDLSDKCNLNLHWAGRKYCQQSCYKAGLGYEGDVCCGINVAVASTAAASIAPPRPHPHAGARFPDGTWGYVADVTAARRRVGELWKTYKTNFSEVQELPVPNGVLNFSLFLPMSADEFEEVCNTKPTQGTEGKGGWKLLSQKVVVDGPEPEPNATILPKNASSSVRRERVGDPPRVLCAQYTHAAKHSLVRSAVETWGHRCDGFFAASNETIPEDGIVDLPHYGEEEYDNMWQKTRSIWAFIHDNYMDDFDYFHLSGDDVHVIVENLRNFLWSVGGGRGSGGGSYPLYLGEWIPSSRGRYFAGGGPGYTLNRKSLRILVRDVLPKCETTTKKPYEDRLIGGCLMRAGIVANRTWDAIGEQRYHGMKADFVYNFNASERKAHYFARVHRFWEEKVGRPNGLGLESASSQSVSFHLLKEPVWMKRQHAILYRSCPQGTSLGDALSNGGAAVAQ